MVMIKSFSVTMALVSYQNIISSMRKQWSIRRDLTQNDIVAVYILYVVRCIVFICMYLYILFAIRNRYVENEAGSVLSERMKTVIICTFLFLQPNRRAYDALQTHKGKLSTHSICTVRTHND